MCIVCNCPPDSSAAHDFLDAFEDARRAIKHAEEAMLGVAAAAMTPEVKSRYASVHKEMVRLRREWNKLEQKREHQPV